MFSSAGPWHCLQLYSGVCICHWRTIKVHVCIGTKMCWVSALHACILFSVLHRAPFNKARRAWATRNEYFFGSLRRVSQRGPPDTFAPHPPPNPPEFASARSLSATTVTPRRGWPAYLLVIRLFKLVIYPAKLSDQPTPSLVGLANSWWRNTSIYIHTSFDWREQHFVMFVLLHVKTYICLSIYRMCIYICRTTRHDP